VKENHYLSDVYRVDWIEREPFVELHIEANRFLHGMVRLLAGTFVAVGRGKMEPRMMAEILASQDVRKSGQKAPASGLTLVKVGYRAWPDV
jgi:tRNA pseudouridine38-40 synthase